MSTLVNWYPGDQVVRFLVVVSAAVTVVAACGLVVSWGLRRRPAVRHGALLSALVCSLASPLAATVFLASGVSLGMWSATTMGDRAARPADVEGAASDYPVPGAFLPGFPYDGGTLAEREAAGSPRVTSPHFPAAASRARSAESKASVRDRFRAAVTACLLAWYAGTVVLLVGFGRAWRRVRGLRDSASVIPLSRIASALEGVPRQVGIRSIPPVAVSRYVRVPLAAGLFRPVTILPASAVDVLDRESLRDVLVHELAHIVRRDQLAVVLQALAKAVFWPIVLIHLLNRALANAREEVCDNFVLAGRNAVRYGATLLRLSELALGGNRLAASVGVLHWRGRLETRIAGLMDGRRSRATRSGRLGWLAPLAAFAGVSLLLCSTAGVASPDETGKESDRAAARKPRPSGAASGLIADVDVSAAELVQGVYDSFSWVDSVKSFRIRTKYQNLNTEEARRRPNRNPFGGNEEPDPRPYCVDADWAWDETRIRYHRRSYSLGDVKARSTTRIWDGSFAVDYSRSADGEHEQYVFGDETVQFFPQLIEHMAYLPWGPGGVHNFWWAPTDVAEERAKRGVSPEDFELEGREVVDGRMCHVVVSRVGHYRLHIGVDDGRLYRRTWLYVFDKDPDYDYVTLCQRIAGPSIKTAHDWRAWIESLPAEEQREAWRELQIAQFEFTRPIFYQTFDDYREVAPGRWLPFLETLDYYSFEAPKPFLRSQSVQLVTDVRVDEPLPDELFEIELKEGVTVATDRRYDPWISYPYRKDQTEEERLAIAEQKRREQAEGAAELARRREVLESRIGSRPPELPRSEWLNGDALSWADLRGKVVVLHFWEVDCPPCDNELPLLARWHEDSDDAGIIVLGVHPPTEDVAAVRKKLEKFGAEYPVLIDAPPATPDGIGEVHDWFGNTWWPNTVLVNKRGEIAGHGKVWLGDVADQMRRLAAEGEEPGR